MDRLTASNFKEFYTCYYDRCFLFAKSYVHDDLVAEDIASESLIKLWKMSEMEAISNPSTLLFVIIKNKALDHLKHERIKQNVLTSISAEAQRELDIRISTLEANNPNNIFSEDIQSILRVTLAKLPPQTRAIFEMSRYKNISRKAIATHFNISAKGVDYHLSIALSRLRENLKDYFVIILSFLINVY